MAELGEFYGVSLEYDNTEALFRGISLEFQENLILRFFDSFGDPINTLDELSIFDGTTTTILNNVSGGSYSLLVETETVFIVTATNDGKEAFASFVHEAGDQYLVIDLQLLIPPCIEERTVTPLNFFHWHRVNNILLSGFGAGDFSPCNKTYPEWLPNIIAEQDNECYWPVIVEDEEISIQLNLNTDTEIDFSNCVLSLVKNYQIVKDSIAPLNIVTDSFGNEKVYFSYTHEKGFRTGDGYQFMIYSQADGYVKLLSNQFDILPINSEYDKDTVFIEARNSSDYNYFAYKGIPNFYNKVRLQLQAINYDYEYNIDAVDEEATGERRTQLTLQRKFVQLEMILSDQYMHDALFSLSSHDDIIINGDAVELKTGFSPSKQREMKRGQGVIEFYIKKYSTLNLKE